MKIDWLLVNGRFYTMDTDAPQATAVAIWGERIVAVGEADALRSEFSAKNVLDLGGRCVIPGLTDAHIHFQGYALNLQRVDLFEVPGKEEALARIAARVAATPPGAWIRGRGWNQDLWPERAFPTAADLDRVAPQHPVALAAKSGHAWWVSSLALETAGITADTPDPAGSQIVRDASGRPTGVLLEMGAIDLVRDCVPEPTPDEIEAALRAAFPNAWRLGLTGVHDCDGRSAFQAYQRLHERGELGLRVHKHIPVKRLDDAIGVGLRSGLGDDRLWVGHVKIFADGALGPRTAWMIAPYAGDPHNTGLPVNTPEELAGLVHTAAANGFACAIHAIGDMANRAVLDAFAQSTNSQLTISQSTNSQSTQIPHRIEHVQLLHPADVGRLAALGVVASMQPIHATQDMEMAERYWGERSRWAYAWRSLLERGTRLAFGSDAPVEDLNPFVGLHAAVTRRRADGSPGPRGWYPQERLSVAEAVRAYTLGPAWVAGKAGRLGSLTPGKLADLVVLDRDIFEAAPDEILKTRSVGTMIGGEWMVREM